MAISSGLVCQWMPQTVSGTYPIALTQLYSLIYSHYRKGGTSGTCFQPKSYSTTEVVFNHDSNQTMWTWIVGLI